MVTEVYLYSPVAFPVVQTTAYPTKKNKNKKFMWP